MSLGVWLCAGKGRAADAALQQCLSNMRRARDVLKLAYSSLEAAAPPHGSDGPADRGL
jgi:hypothetical protein